MPWVHIEEDGAKSSRERSYKLLCQLENFKFRPSPKSSRHEAQVKLKSYGFRSGQGFSGSGPTLRVSNLMIEWAQTQLGELIAQPERCECSTLLRNHSCQLARGVGSVNLNWLEDKISILLMHKPWIAPTRET